MNALKHGQRSAESRAVWRDLNAALRTLRDDDRLQANTLGDMDAADVWIGRIMVELTGGKIER